MKTLIVVFAAATVAVSVATAGGGWAGRPGSAPPKRGPSGPPPAWLESNASSAWLTYGSYCWTASSGSAACADMIPPANRPDLAVLRVRLGETLRFHLPFIPKEAAITAFSKAPAVPTRMRPARVIQWRPKRLGIFGIDLHASGGSASYVFRLAGPK